MLCVSDTRMYHYIDLYPFNTLTFDIITLQESFRNSLFFYMDDVLCLRIIILIQCTGSESNCYLHCNCLDICQKIEMT